MEINGNIFKSTHQNLTNFGTSGYKLCRSSLWIPIVSGIADSLNCILDSKAQDFWEISLDYQIFGSAFKITRPQLLGCGRVSPWQVVNSWDLIMAEIILLAAVEKFSIRQENSPFKEFIETRALVSSMIILFNPSVPSNIFPRGVASP